MALSEYNYEFEADEKFMDFLRTRGADPSDTEWWQSEYSGNLYGMYAAWQAGFEWGKNQGREQVEPADRIEQESQGSPQS